MESRQVVERKGERGRERERKILQKGIQPISQQLSLPVDPLVFDLRLHSSWASPASN